jgi:predicted ATPase/DNA-binding SARP family transcriptional activator
MNSKVTYRQQFTRCGKQRCRKCREGAGHGPYWYAYWSEKGRTVSKYIGTHLPENIEAAQALQGEEERETIRATTMQPPSSPIIRIYLLGQFRIERRHGNEWRSVDSRIWHRRRARALLGCLLSNAGRRLGREQVMELLWPDLDIDVAANRLNGAVHELRQILEPEIARPAASRLLRLERDVLELADSSQVWIDAEAFENLLKEADAATDPEQTERLLEEADALYRGSYLLEELYSEWAAPRRDALQRGWVGLLLKLANLRVERGAFVSAIETLDRLRTADPTNETALQRLMILLTQLDRRGEALQIYRQHVSMLQRDYESDPLPETRALYDALREGQVPVTAPGRATATKEKEETPRLASSEAAPSASRQEVVFSRPLFQLGRHNQSPLIGRDRELDTMRQVMLVVEGVAAKGTAPAQAEEMMRRALHAAAPASRPKQPHFLLLRGEAGIGKTRLAEELSIEAYTRGWAVAWSRSYEQERTIPYRPWTELLRTLLHGTAAFSELTSSAAPDSSPSLPTPSPFKLERLSALLPELAVHTPFSATRPSPPLSHEQERLHLWEATQGLLGTLSKTHPLLLVFDDLHWADDSSIELLTYLTHHLQDQRVLLVATCRDGELTPLHKLRALMTDLRREQAIVTLSVQPLTQSQIGTLVAHLPRDIVESIQSQAAGNPFFAEELARYVGANYSDEDPLIVLNEQAEDHAKDLAKDSARGSASIHPSLASSPQQIERDTPRPYRSLPEAIAAVLERRLNRLSRGCQTLLGKAAVLGGSFELRQLLPMAREHSEDTVLDLLEEALQAGLLTEEGTGAYITYHFWHPLIISHLYERLSAARRAQLHRRAAEAIKTAYASSQQEKVAAAIVHHLSRGGGDPAQIASYAELAGNQAYSLAAYSEAQQYYLQEIQAITGNGRSASEGIDVHKHIRRITPGAISKLTSSDPLHICRLLERVAECSMVLGNFEDARHLYECILDVRTGKDFSQRLSSAAGDEEKRRQEAQIQALLWREIGNTWTATGEYARAYECYGRGKEVMSRAGVTTGAAWACLHLQYGAMLRLEGKYHEARCYLQEALEMLECAVQQSLSLQQETGAASSGQEQEPYASSSEGMPANKELQTHTERALLGDPLEIGDAHEKLGIVAASVGQLNEGIKHMHTALRIYEQNELVSQMVRVCGNLGAAYIVKCEHKAARTYLQRALELAERAGDLPNMAHVMLNLGDAFHRTGDLLESEKWYKHSLSLAERINDRERMNGCLVELATVQEDLGNLQEAAASIRRAISIGRAIKSSRCIRYALIVLGDLRITCAIIECEAQPLISPADPQCTPSGRRYLLRAKSTLERAISIEEVEAEAIIDAKHLLSLLYFLLDDLDAAEQLALQTVQEAQENEMTRVMGRAYRLLGRIMMKRERRKGVDYYFEQAIQIFREHELRLDYARALHGYGIALVQHAMSEARQHTSSNGLPSTTTQVKDRTYQQGLNYLYEARAIFADCQAALDLSWVEHALEQIGAPEAVTGPGRP